jgi:filamentous hemagglutinin family protein
LLVAAVILLAPRTVVANPKGEQVTAGQAKFDRSGSQLNITTSDRVIIKWDSFNIAPHEMTRFIQPGAGSIALNRITDANPSQIFGSLQANGNVFLLNGNGILFGPNAKVNVNGLVATSLSISDQDFLNGNLRFAGHDQNGAVKNFGTIETLKGGFAYLLAPNVENSGIIKSPDGHIALAAGTTAYLSNRPDGRGLLVEVKAPSGQAVNLRDLIADGGRVGIYGRAVNQAGIVQANTVEERNGEIELVASDRVYLESGSRTEAKGADSGVSAGGSVKVVAGGGTAGTTPGDVVFKRDAVIDVSGGAEGGDAGQAELSASGGMVLEGEVTGRAAPGSKGGELLIDPVNVTITAFAPSSGDPLIDPPGTGTWAFDSPALPANLVLNTSTSFIGLSDIRVEAGQDITLANDTGWILAPGVTDLTLRAGNDIVFGTNARIFDAGAAASPLRLNLIAGANFQGGDLFDVTAGVGDIVNPFVQIGSGEIRAVAGNGIALDQGAIRTTAGGSIDLTAVAGDIDAGRNSNWFIQSGANALRLDTTQGVGGIATQAGGDITLTALNGLVSSDFSHIGAYSIGTGASGDVAIQAHDFVGHFFVGNGHADVRLSGDFGNSVRTTTIDLANGSTAYVEAESIHLGQIRNPQGALSRNHRFNYGDAAVELVARTGSVLLAGDAVAGNTDGINLNRILAPTLTARALAGDILINNDFVLFPSPTGNLVLDAFSDITNSIAFTVDLPEGSLPPDPFASPLDSAARMPTITVSDADPLRLDPPVNQPFPLPDFSQDLARYYAETHRSTPIHTGDATPIRISTVEGDVSRVAFVFPKASEWDIGGDLGIVTFDGQNLAPGDVTRFDVHGNLDWGQRLAVVDGSTVIVNGRGDDPTVTAIRLGGPGALEINVSGFADLGESEGIQTVGGLFNRNLNDNSPDVPDADITDNGADIRIRVGPDTLGGQGTPVMTDKGLVNQQNFSLVNSRIASFAGGDIDVAVNNGTLNVGRGSIGVVDSILARGIYTAVGGNIELVALKDVNVRTSRVGTFNGGAIDITAVEGTINAGEGTKDQPSEVPAVGEQGLAFEINGTGIISSSLSPDRQPGRITLTAGREVRTGAAGITCTGANSSACSVSIVGNVALGSGGITSGGNVNISGNVSGTGTISGGAVNVGGTVTGGTISASSGSGAVVSAAASVASTTTTETSQASRTVSGGAGEGDDEKKKKRRRYIRRGVIIEVTGKPAA